MSELFYLWSKQHVSIISVLYSYFKHIFLFVYIQKASELKYIFCVVIDSVSWMQFLWLLCPSLLAWANAENP